MSVFLFKAQNAAQNIFRGYCVLINKTLFNEYAVTTQWGRLGQKYQSKTFYFSSLEESDIFVKKVIKKRLNSEKRIGVNYVCGKA